MFLGWRHPCQGGEDPSGPGDRLVSGHESGPWPEKKSGSGQECDSGEDDRGVGADEAGKDTPHGGQRGSGRVSTDPPGGESARDLSGLKPVQTAGGEHRVEYGDAGDECELDRNHREQARYLGPCEHERDRPTDSQGAADMENPL